MAIPVDKLQASINKVLKEYGDDVQGNLEVITKEFAKKGAQAVKSAAKSQGWGGSTGYDTGLTSQVETNRYSAQGVIYNQKVPGLPHLLEHGHALRNGGRSRAFPHIAPVEEKLVEEFLKAVEHDL